MRALLPASTLIKFPISGPVVRTDPTAAVDTTPGNPAFFEVVSTAARACTLASSPCPSSGDVNDTRRCRTHSDLVPCRSPRPPVDKTPGIPRVLQYCQRRLRRAWSRSCHHLSILQECRPFRPHTSLLSLPRGLRPRLPQVGAPSGPQSPAHSGLLPCPFGSDSVPLFDVPETQETRREGRPGPAVDKTPKSRVFCNIVNGVLERAALMTGWTDMFAAGFPLGGLGRSKTPGWTLFFCVYRVPFLRSLGYGVGFEGGRMATMSAIALKTRVVCLAAALAWGGATAWGDTVTVGGGTLEGTINGIRGGKLSMTLKAGGEKQVPLDDVTALAVDGQPQFAAAEGVRGDNLKAVKAYRIWWRR